MRSEVWAPALVSTSLPHAEGKQGAGNDEGGEKDPDSGSANISNQTSSTTQKVFNSMEMTTTDILGGTPGDHNDEWRTLIYRNPALIDFTLSNITDSISDPDKAVAVQAEVDARMKIADVKVNHKAQIMFNSFGSVEDGSRSGAQISRFDTILSLLDAEGASLLTYTDISCAALLRRDGWFNIGHYAMGALGWDTTGYEGLMIRDIPHAGVPLIVEGTRVNRTWGMRSPHRLGLFKLTGLDDYVSLSDAFFRDEEIGVHVLCHSDQVRCDIDAVTEMSRRSSLQNLRSQSRSRSPESASSSTNSVAAAPGTTVKDYPEQHCFYKEYLRSQRLRVDEDDYLLLEHLKSGHLPSCSPLSPSAADDVVQSVPITEEVPFEEVHCLTRVGLNEGLLTSRHVRLLKLFPRTHYDTQGESPIARALWRSQLGCEIYQASLDDLSNDGPPLFVGASYVCGDQTPAAWIRCDHRIVTIPKNVFNALLHLRLENRPRLIWIDFLSIRQNDDREKSHQVSMLHKIYPHAHVVTWLGAGRDFDWKDASSYLQHIARFWTSTVRINAKAEDRADRFEDITTPDMSVRRGGHKQG
jgi:hypothetical protein